MIERYFLALKKPVTVFTFPISPFPMNLFTYANGSRFFSPNLFYNYFLSLQTQSLHHTCLGYHATQLPKYLTFELLFPPNFSLSIEQSVLQNCRLFATDVLNIARQREQSSVAQLPSFVQLFFIYTHYIGKNKNYF